MRVLQGHCRAFTLVEILIVVIVLGILAAIVVPQFSAASQDATGATLRTTLSIVRTAIEQQYHKAGSYPTTIDPAWFAGNKLPQHPENYYGVADVQVLSSAGMKHPGSKVLKSGVLGAFWYNPAEGVFRARVADQGSSAATLDFYNLVNDSAETALGNYTGGGLS